MAYTTIDDPTKYFDTTLWTGSGGAKTITGLEFKPDLIWTKTRSVTYNHMLSDSSRGFNANSELGSNSTAVEGGLSAETYGYKSGHTSDGWTMVDGTDTVDGQEDGNTNQPSVTYVGWTWKANGGTTTNQTGADINSVTQADTTAGFSIVTYTGDGNTTQTVKHGLGGVPEAIIMKNRERSSNWESYFAPVGNSHIMELSTTAAKQDTDNYGNTDPTSTVFTVDSGANNANASGEDIVAYCFRSIQGYSKIGSYKGNGNTDGPFVYTGFKPAWVMVKESDGTGQWRMRDNKRSTFNPVGVVLYANGSATETTEDNVDFLSNGFKVRTSGGENNGSGDNYLYMAFAEHPFVSSKGIPVTAR